MKILMLCEGNAETRDSWSGVSRSVVEHLREAGHEVVAGDVDLHGFSRGWMALRTVVPDRRRWRMRYRLHGPAFRARSRNAARRVRELGGEVDLILQIGATFAVPEGTGKPLALYCDSNIEFSRAAAGTGYSEATSLSRRELEAIRKREAAVYGEADLIFTMSDRVRASFIEDFGVPEDRLVTLHCGPNVRLAETAERIRPLEGPPTILFVGRDFRRKGGDLLLTAFERVRERISEARLLMVGVRIPGAVPEGVEAWGYQDRDTEEGKRAMDRAFREARVFCLPTRFEPFGTSFLEAMVYQLPCVGPRAWAVPEIIRDGETGYLVPPEDPDALADALVRLLADPKLSRRLGRAARERALAWFTWPAIIARMEAALNPLVNGASRGTGRAARHPASESGA